MKNVYNVDLFLKQNAYYTNKVTKKLNFWAYQFYD